MSRKLKPRTPFAERLIAARGGMSRAEFASRMGAPLTTVAGWERGVSFPPPDVLVRISDLFQVSLDWLIAGRATPFVVSPANVDEALLIRIQEVVQATAAEERVVLSSQRHVHLAARLYCDLVRVFDVPEDRLLGLRALLPQLRRDILDA
jgi:transcriptional regulator with XRE-family HTH domain